MILAFYRLKLMRIQQKPRRKEKMTQLRYLLIVPIKVGGGGVFFFFPGKVKVVPFLILLLSFSISDEISNSLQQKKKKTKKVVEKYWDWELINETQPIWVSLQITISCCHAPKVCSY